LATPTSPSCLHVHLMGSTTSWSCSSVCLYLSVYYMDVFFSMHWRRLLFVRFRM
jgi:hypothetical protein